MIGRIRQRKVGRGVTDLKVRMLLRLLREKRSRCERESKESQGSHSNLGGESSTLFRCTYKQGVDPRVESAPSVITRVSDN